ncbi:hypothetical protein CTAYLR_005551 [Chrysophaeum taylorii]|uniref:Uncharacterized protein n=1 Tax=Chrysophaeum taylorii TaxID=2483200 RepID=A0AAD7ULA6_9STRA|nr:hypothetical protein CTAYLR_005551 [Chrysophaeum taylorii]
MMLVVLWTSACALEVGLVRLSPQRDTAVVVRRRFLAGLASSLTTTPVVSAMAAADLSWAPLAKPEEDEAAAAWFNAEFVTYFSRILLNYDAACSAWWRQQSRSNWNFQEFVASVAYSLRKYETPEMLLEMLEKEYTSVEKRRQLALAFTLLGPSQPTSGIKRLLSRVPADSRGGGIVGTILPPNSPNDYLQADPLLLLPRTQVPVLSGDLYEIRGLAPFPTTISLKRVAQERPLNASTYASFAAAGAVGCSLTHVTLVPLDVVKTRMQTSEERSALEIARREGLRGLTLGFAPTLLGYAYYGVTVYPGFELLTRLAPHHLSRPTIVLASGALATLIACVGACPAEAVRIRIVADPETYRAHPIRTILRNEGVGALYAGFGPLVVRQVLFGTVKFFFFDTLADAIFALNPTLQTAALSRLAVAFFAGLVAGTVSSLVSQPADAILTKINQGKRPWEAAGLIFNQDGIRGFYKGALERCAWAGLVISGQFAIYDALKSLLSVSATDLTVVLNVVL